MACVLVQQGSALARSIDIVNRMIRWRLKDDPIDPEADPETHDPVYRASTRCKIFLGYTSNIVSSGLREVIRYLAEHRMIDVICTTAGGVEEDLIKVLAHSYLGDFSLSGAALRDKGINRAGNVLIPNSNYCQFQDWMFPILDAMIAEQKSEGTLWSPSKVIRRLGLEIGKLPGCEASIYYWAAKHNIPVYSPALTDGSIGDMMFFHSYENAGLVVDLVSDIRAMNEEAVFARKTGVLLIGGGMIKHHILNANMMRNGADFAVYINTGQEFDGSDSGARPDEAVSWGKLKAECESVKLYAEATLVVPILVAETFARHFEPRGISS